MKKFLLVSILFLFVSIFAFADEYVVATINSSNLVHQFNFTASNLSIDPIRAVANIVSESSLLATLLNYMDGQEYEFVESLGKQAEGRNLIWTIIFKKKK